MVNSSALGNLMGELIKIGTGAIQWLSDLIFGYGTSNAKLDVDKLSVVPYKLPTSAYNYVVNGSFEYGTWGGDESQDTTAAKFGKYGASMPASGTNKNSGYSNFIDIRGMTTITLSVWTLINITIGNFYCQVYFYKSDKTACSTISADMAVISATETVYTQHSHTYTIATDFPSDCKFIRVKTAWWNISGNPSGTAWFDCWQSNMGDQIPTFQDFTTYSYSWMPEKIETIATSSYAWSSINWTDLLELTFECESTMLCTIFAHCSSAAVNKTGAAIDVGVDMKLTLDGTDIDETAFSLLDYEPNNYGFDMVYSVHSVKIMAKGSHSLKIRARTYRADVDSQFLGRRLTILKGFYQGGTT
jgi:hypothetical protein